MVCSVTWHCRGCCQGAGLLQKLHLAVLPSMGSGTAWAGCQCKAGLAEQDLLCSTLYGKSSFKDEAGEAVCLAALHAGTWQCPWQGRALSIRGCAQQHLFASLSSAAMFSVSLQACGSGGTTAGLALGLHLSGSKAKLHSFGVCDDPDYFNSYVQELIDGMGAQGEAKEVCEQPQWLPICGGRANPCKVMHSRLPACKVV